MTVFSRVLKKVSRWELPTSDHPRRALSSPSGQSLSASRSLKDVAAPYGLLDQETEQSDYATQLSEGRLGATRALIDQIVDDSGQLQSASHSLKDMAALHGLKKEKSGFNAINATASHSCKELAAPCGYREKSGFDAKEAAASHSCKELAAPCGYRENSGFDAKEAAASHSCKELAAPCGYSENRGYNYALAAPSSEEYTGASRECNENGESTEALKTKFTESNTVTVTSSITIRKNSIAVETITFVVCLVIYYLILLVYSMKLSDLFARSTPSLEACLSGTFTFCPTCEMNTTRSSHTAITFTASTTGRTMSFFTLLTVYCLILLVRYLVKKSKEYCENFVISLLNSSYSVSETTPTVRSRKVYTASSSKANKSFSSHLIVFFVILLVYSSSFSDPLVKSSPDSKSSLSTAFAILNFTETSEANRTSTMSIWSASSTAGPTMSFCTHVIVYYLMLLVYLVVNKVKECCVKFVRSFLNSNSPEPAPSNVYSPCNFCDRDMTYSEILDQLEPALYCPVTPQYIACECKNVNVDTCNDNYNPCTNAWFNCRLHEKNKSLFEYFGDSAIRGMLFDKQITVATAVEIFDIPLPVRGSVLEIELLLQCLQDEYNFTLKCADCGDILSTPVICGGSKKKPFKFGRIRKKSKVTTNRNDISDRLSDKDGDEIELNENTVGVTEGESEFEFGLGADEATNEKMICDSDTDSVEKVKAKSKQARYNSSNKGKAAKKRYRSGIKGKRVNIRNVKKYSGTIGGKVARNKAIKVYFDKDEGRAARHKANKTYFGTNEGQAARSRTNRTYNSTNEGKAARSRANRTYYSTNEGRAATSDNYTTYSGSKKGISARIVARKAYKQRARRNARLNKTHLVDGNMPVDSECMSMIKNIHIDFSSKKAPGNTESLMNHEIPSELAERYRSFETEILRGRCLLTAPKQYSTVEMKKANAYYKHMLARKLQSVLDNLSVSDESWKTIPGISTKSLKRKHFNPRNRASIILAELAWLKRQQCITVLKIQLNRLSSYAHAIISKMNIQEKESDKKAALLGHQGHQKTSEPFHTSVSYVNGSPYNYEAEIKRFEEAKASSKRAPSHISYTCDENCILPDAKEELTELMKLFDDCAKLCDSSPGEFRKYLSKFQWCTKWHEYPESEKSDLNPMRMYLYPVKHRNHPKNCYIPSQSNDCSLQNSTCKSQEIIMRKFMVHYANPRKFYGIISKAITAHKLMCDIDASSIMGDVEYLSKLVKIELQYDDSIVGFDTLSEAREWTADSIEEKLADTAIQGKSSKTTFSHRELFDNDRKELPSVRCYCCNKLVTPKQSSIINLNTSTKLKYDPAKNIQPHQVFQRFQDFLIEKEIIQDSENDETHNGVDNGGSFENHPTKLLHGLSICRSCRDTLNRGEIPANSIMNNMFVGETPEVLKVLNPIELMFVSKTKCFQTIIKPGPISSKLPKSERLSAIKGNMIHLPLTTSATANTLYKSATERLFGEVEDLVLLYGKPNKDKEVWNHIVDRTKVLAALTWLCENNPNYKDIVVPTLAEDILPHVFGYGCDLCQTIFETAIERNMHRESCQGSSDQSYSEENSSLDDECDKNSVENHNPTESVLNCSQELEFQCELDSDDECIGLRYVDSEFSDEESDRDVNNPDHDENTSSSSQHTCKYCEKVFNSVFECNTHENDCTEKIKDSFRLENENSDTDQSNANINEKPWIEQVPKDSLNDGFRHFRTVGNEARESQAKEIFRMLNIDSNPIPYYEPNVDCESFPEQFPYGTGGRTALREKKLRDATYEQTRLMTSDNYQRRNIQYLLNLVGQKEKRLIKEGIFSVQNKNFKSMTKKDISLGAKQENSELLKRISTVLRKLPTQREFWSDVRSKVEAMVFEFGPPTFWATFSPGEYDDPELLAYLRERNSDLSGVESMTVSQLVCKDPILACTYLQTKFDATLKFLLSDANPIGKIKNHFVRTEYQTRLMPHFHCFFWVEDAPIIGRDSEDTILNFIGKYVSCKLPSPNEDPIMHGLVKKYQSHHCNSYCLRKPKEGRGKARCKFGFPRAACAKPVLHGVATSIAAHKTGSYQKRLYELQRKHNEQFINDYNPTLLYLWRGNVDIQYIGEESESLVDYISKYATKAPRSAISDFELDAVAVSDKSNFGKLFQLAAKLMKDRELGVMEARNFMLSEKPIRTNASFMFINTVYASKRKSVLKSKKDMESLPDDSKDIYYGDLIGTWYPKRPPYDKSNNNSNLKNMSLYDFARTYERVGNASAAQLKNKSKLLKLDGGAGFMKKRTNDPEKDPFVIYGPSHLDPIKDSEAYYFAFLLLHKPFWHEHLLMGRSHSYQAEFERLKAELPAMAAHEKKYRVKKNFREMMENDADTKADQMSTEIEDTYDNDQANVDSGSDFFETVRKQSSIETSEQLKKAVDGLSPDQLAVYEMFVENVEHYYRHKTHICSCVQFEPLRLFVSGFGGSGKSHLIRTLMAYQFIRSEVEKEPRHFLLGAPTGIASHNIGGMTLHSMWNLPVNHSRNKNCGEEYRKLKSSQLNRMRANYEHACGLIVDEVSMISNSMLMAINFRMMEVMGSKDHEAFGGMPILMFGDLFQLEPVNGNQPFVPLSSKITQKMFGGFPCAPNLWEIFRFRQLNTNHRQQGDENQKWRAILDHARYGMLSASDIEHLNQRMIDTSGCKLQKDYLDRYVTTFLEYEEKGFEPVCLLPTNKMVKEFNQAVMKKKGEVPETVKCIDTFSCRNDKLLSAAKKILVDLDSDKTGGLERALDLAVNTRVMLRVNDKRTAGLVNGARGTVRNIKRENSGTGHVVSKISVKFDGIDEVQIIERIERKFLVLPNCYVYRKMFPLINSYSMTIHKSQSLSLPCVFADLGDRIFADGMSYVALSRCLSHKGLHLMNFKPESVKASNKACKEYARLTGMSFKGNSGCKLRMKLERPWYTTFVQDKATKSTTDKINETATGKRKKYNDAPSAKKTKNSTKSKTKANPSIQTENSSSNEIKPTLKVKPIITKNASKEPTNVPEKTEADIFSDSDTRNNLKTEAPRSPGCNSNTNTDKERNEIPTPTSSMANQSDDNIIVTNVHYRTINYVPVYETWQRSICNAFGWKFTAPSRGRNMKDLYRLHCETKPETPTDIGGDGNCWFRAIALIATGDQANFMDVKNSVIQFMWANIDALQKTYEDIPYYRDRWYRFKFNSQYAKNIILHHSKPNEWVRNVVMEMTAVMLKTRYYLYYAGEGNGWISIDNGTNPVWSRRDQFRTYPLNVNRESIPQLSEQSIYINHKNRNHFETCHNTKLQIRR